MEGDLAKSIVPRPKVDDDRMTEIGKPMQRLSHSNLARERMHSAHTQQILKGRLTLTKICMPAMVNELDSRP